MKDNNIFIKNIIKIFIKKVFGIYELFILQYSIKIYNSLL